MPTPTVFGEWLKKLRDDLGLSQGELADLTGLTTATISRYESGARLPHGSENVESIIRAVANRFTPARRRRLMLEARAASAGIDFRELVKEVAEEAFADGLATYDGDNPALRAARSTYESVNQALSRTEDKPPSGEEI